MHARNLLMAIKSNHINAVLKLMNHVNLEEEIDDKLTPIQIAAKLCHWDCVEVIAKNKKADANDRYRYGCALLDAVSNDKIDTVKVLLEAGASKNWTYQESGDGSLHIAIRNRNKYMIALLLSFDFDLTKKNNEGQTPPQLADELTYIKYPIESEHYKKYREHSDILNEGWRIYYDREIAKIISILTIFIQAIRQPTLGFYKIPDSNIDLIFSYLSNEFTDKTDTLKRRRDSLTKISMTCFMNEYNTFFSWPSLESKNLVTKLGDMLSKGQTEDIHKEADCFLKNNNKNCSNSRTASLLYKYKLISPAYKNQDEKKNHSPSP